MIRAFASGSLALSAIALSASASGETTDQRESDEAVYTRECALCHAQMGTGTLMLARRLGEENAILAERQIPLAGPYVEYVVRNGLGSMPAITRVEVTDEQLAQIVRHLTQLDEEGGE